MTSRMREIIDRYLAEERPETKYEINRRPVLRLITPLRPDCAICDATLVPGSAWHCPDCVDRLTRERDERWRESGRGP